MPRNTPRSSGYGLGHPDVAQYLLESLPEPGLLCDEEGTVRAWSQRALTLFGLSGDGLCGLDLPALFQGPQSEQFARELARTRSIGMGETSLPFQIPDGPRLRLTFYLMDLGHEADDWILVTATLAELPSEETAGPARALLSQSPSGLLVLHTYWISYANPAGSELLGYNDPFALTGLPLSELVYEPDRARMGDLLDRALRQTNPQDRLRLYDTNGSAPDMEISLSLLGGTRSPTLQVSFGPSSKT